MTSIDTKTWLVTGAGRGMGVDFARAALDAGHNVVGIRTMIVEPGFFRTELMQPASTTYAELSIDDYAERTGQTIPAWQAINGRQAGDQAKLARALVELADSDEPPPRWVVGEDAVEGVEEKARLLLAQVDAHRELSTSLAHEDAKAAA